MISVVVCSIDRWKFAAVSTHYQQLLGAERHEIIGIHDAQSLCEGYNRGLALSHGDVIIFAHDDIEILTPHLLPRLREHLARFDIIGVAGTNRLCGPKWFLSGIPYTFGQVAHDTDKGTFLVSIFGIPSRVIGGIQALDGLFLAFRRPVVEQLGWDAATFTGFHCYDLDMTFRAYRAGYKLAVVNDLPIRHMKLRGDYGADWEPYARAFLAKHQAALAPPIPWRTQYGSVTAATREEAAQVMEDLCDSTNQPA